MKVRLLSPAPDLDSFILGWVPEWPKGADCKSVVTDFGGSNPPPSTNMREWRNWQTRTVQVRVKAISCRFKSCFPHQANNLRFSGGYLLTEVKTGLEGRSSESGSSGAREPTHGLRPASLKTPHSGVFPALGPPTKPAGANQVLFPAPTKNRVHSDSVFCYM